MEILRYGRPKFARVTCKECDALYKIYKHEFLKQEREDDGASPFYLFQYPACKELIVNSWANIEWQQDSP